MRHIITMMASAAAALAHQPREVEPTGSRSIDEIAAQQREAARQRAMGKQLVRKAADDLVGSGDSHIVLGHIHPRWLRAEVERRIAAGELLTAERVAEIRIAGR